MASSNDPWSASLQESKAEPTSSTPEFAPFTLLSCRKAYDARLLPRKKLHTFSYAVLLLSYLFFFATVIWIGINSLESINRADLLATFIELAVIGWMLKHLFQKNGTERVTWDYKFHLFSVSIIRAFLWILLISLPLIILEVIKPNHELFTWYGDDINLASNLLYLIILIQGARYFSKDGDNE